jgi:hypothetical protein
MGGDGCEEITSDPFGGVYKTGHQGRRADRSRPWRHGGRQLLSLLRDGKSVAEIRWMLDVGESNINGPRRPQQGRRHAG